MQTIVTVLIPTQERHRRLLEASAPDFSFHYSSPEAVTQEELDHTDILIGNPPQGMLHGSPRLQWLQCNSAGVEPFLQPGVLHFKTLLTNATGAYGLAISEHMLGMLLEIFKKLHLYRDAQHQHQWQSLGQVRSIEGSTVLVLGMGDIGGEFARRVKALGAHVIGVRRTDTRCPDYADEVHLTADLDQLLPLADVVAVSLPGTRETAGLLDRRRIALMKEGAVVLNVGRGSIIDTEALCDALESGHLGGAGLDVTDPEPLPAGHRLWDIPNAVITPHISGFYHLPETLERIVRISAANLKAYTEGLPLKNLVDFSTGYRKLP